MTFCLHQGFWTCWRELRAAGLMISVVFWQRSSSRSLCFYSCLQTRGRTQSQTSPVQAASLLQNPKKNWSTRHQYLQVQVEQWRKPQTLLNRNLKTWRNQQCERLLHVGRTKMWWKNSQYHVPNHVKRQKLILVQNIQALFKMVYK